MLARNSVYFCTEVPESMSEVCVLPLCAEIKHGYVPPTTTRLWCPQWVCGLDKSSGSLKSLSSALPRQYDPAVSPVPFHWPI